MTIQSAASASDFRVPDDLTELARWVLWRYETRNGRPTKVPYQINGRRADSTSPPTWTTFEEALGTWNRNSGRYTGIGFVFSKDDGLAGIDLDDSLDENANVKGWARGVIEKFSDTYTEISPSGRGLKIWARGSLPANLPGKKIEDGQIEMYDHSRYFAVTGRMFRGAPLQIENHQADIDALYRHLAQSTNPWKIGPLAGGRIPLGQQHNTLVSLAGTLRARRICDEAIEACLQMVNAYQCEQPGSPEHISRIVRGSRAWGAN